MTPTTSHRREGVDLSRGPAIALRPVIAVSTAVLLPSWQG